MKLKSIKKCLFFVIGLILFSSICYGQKWNYNWNNTTKNSQKTFYESLSDAEDYFTNNPTYVDTPQSGYKDYMRWFNYWKNKISANGTYSEYPDALLNYINATNGTSHSSSNWTIIGPTETPPAYGAHYGSRGMGWTNAMDVFPSQKNLMYAGSNSGGLYKSSNGGAKWDYIPFTEISIGIQSIAIDPNDSNTVYVATGTTIYQKEYGLGLFKTTNGGSTWSRIYYDSGNPSEIIQEVVVDPNNSSNIFIAYKGKIFKSTNGGSTFTQKLNVTYSSNDRNVMFHDLVFKPNSSSTIYAAGKVLFMSTNSGETWTDITNSTSLGNEIFPKIINSNFTDANGNESLSNWSNPSGWSAVKIGSDTYARIKPANNINSTLRDLSGTYFIPSDIYNIKLLANVPAHTTLRIKLTNEFQTSSTTIYDSGEQPTNRTINENFNYLYESYNGWYMYAIIEVTSSTSYNNTDWLQVDYLKIFNTSSDRITIATTPQYSDKVFIGISGFNIYGGRSVVINKSNNNGSTWNYINKFNGMRPLSNKFNLIVSPTDTNRQYIGNVDVYKTTTGWSTTPSIITDRMGTTNRVHDDHRQLLIFNNSGSDEIYSANDGGVSKSTNSGTTWTDISKNLTITQYFGIAGVENNPNLLIGGCQDLSTNLYLDKVWKNTAGGDGYGDPLIDPFNNNIMFSRENNDLIRSTNKFADYIEVPDALEASDLTLLVTDYESQSYTIYAYNANIIKSTSKGAIGTWSAISSSSVIGNSGISSLAISESNPNYIYFSEPFAGTGEKIWRTTVGGGTSSGNWNDITGTLPTQYAGISDIVVDPTDPNRVWVTLGGMSEGNKVYYRNFSQTGTNWVNFSDGIDNSKYNLPVNCIKYWKGSNDGLFIGTDVGVFYRDNSMSEWVEYNNGFHPTVIQDLEINNLDHKIRAGTFARGLWESPLPECNYNSIAYLVEGPDTITTYTKMNRNVIVANNGVFVVKSRLIMSNNTKITVKKGGKVIVDGGQITNTCGGMWDGIIVEGSKIDAQSASTHGWCEVKNNGTIENARIAIKSLSGGIVQIIGGNFYNNRFGVTFNLYSLSNNNQHTNLSVVANSKFICNKPMVDSTVYIDNGIREGSKSFVSIAQQDGIRINNNDFISTYRPRADLKGTGVVTWTSRTYIHNNDFTGLTFGIESGGYLNALQSNSVYNNEFADVSLAITETAMAGSQLRENTIVLPEYESNAWLMENYGIKLDLSRGFNVSNNIIRAPSTISNANTYGVLVKNSQSIPCKIEHNFFRKLEFANQLEGDNNVIGIQCNQYNQSVQDWSINPITVGTIHDFGFSSPSLLQAANYFPDIVQGESLKHIRLNSNMTFTYYSVEEPSDSVLPIHTTDNVIVNSISGSNFEEECEIPFDPCGGNPVPCVAYAQDLVSNNSEVTNDLIFKYKLNLAQQLRDSGMMEELRIMLETETSSEWEELKLPIYIEYGVGMNIDAQELIDSLPSGEYKNFMQVILDIKNENIPIDSVAETGLTENIEGISVGNSAISVAAKKILELFYGYQYVREAERWEETNMLVQNNDTLKKLFSSNSSNENIEKKELLESKMSSNPDLLIIPNPNDGNFVVQLISSASGVVYIYDMHGKIISQFELSENEYIYINKGSVSPGIYNIRLINSSASYQLNKKIVILE